ncbi:MAG: transporter [Zetaproteobacteria bacterium CG1_02_53_45]|nr:MAG: transporter [Zetaproteobacteria bacterium CG1_02_53_45]
MQFLNEFRTKAYGLPDLLPWAALVDDGVVLTKAGGFITGFWYSGPDLDSATPSELGNMAARINASLKLGDGWIVNVDAVRAAAPGYAVQGAFPDRTTRLIDDVRRKSHEGVHAGYTSHFALTVTWFPKSDMANKTSDMFVEGRAKGTASRNLERFQAGIREIQSRLSGVVRIRKMADTVDEVTGDVTSELLGFLEYCVTGTLRPFRMAEVPMYLDAVLGRHDFVTGFEPRIGKKHVVALAIDGFPGSSFPGILDFLSRLPIAYRWSNRFIFLDPNQAEKVINGYRSKWAQKRKSMMNVVREQSGGAATHINLDADGMANDAVAAIAEANSGQVRFGYYSSVILLSDENPDLLIETAREVKKIIENKGFGCRIEDLNAVEAYLGSMPGDTKANVRRPIINTMNLSHLLPFTAVWAGPEKHPCPFYPANSAPLLYAKTDGSTPFRLTLHAGDLGHTAIIGPTGSGKSTLLATLVAQQFRFPNAQVFAFDKGYSMLPLCWAAGGQHYDVAGENSLAFCPLGRINEPAEQAWAADWIESMVIMQGVTVTPRDRDDIYKALVNLGQSTTEQNHRTLTNYVAVIQSEHLRDALRYYTLEGAVGHLLDAESDGLGEDSFQVFEMEHLMNLGDKALLPVLTYLFHRIEQRFKGQPTLLILDEAWVMLGHPVFRAKIREWLKVLRKANVACVFATQSLSDLAKSGISDVIFESCPTKILLPNPEAMTENSQPFYRQIGLNTRQIQILSTATPKRQYYVIHPDGRRLFELGLSGAELAFAGASGKEDVARIRELRHVFSDAWPAQWLRERGQSEAAAMWESY